MFSENLVMNKHQISGDEKTTRIKKHLNVYPTKLLPVKFHPPNFLPTNIPTHQIAYRHNFLSRGSVGGCGRRIEVSDTGHVPARVPELCGVIELWDLEGMRQMCHGKEFHQNYAAPNFYPP